MNLFVESKEAEIKLLYKLYRPVKDGLKPIADMYKSFLVKQGQACVEKCETQQDGKVLAIKDILINSNLIENFLHMLKKQNKVIRECFLQDTVFVRQLQLAFQVFINLDVGKHTMAEMLSTYIDKLLRKGGTSDNIDELIEHVVTLFSHLIDKDLFLEVYRNQLARRLLSEKCEDIENEKRLITNLKITCGLQQVNKIQGMITDLTTAKDVSNAYNDYKLQNPKANGLDFRCQVLTTANWPSYKLMKVSIPI
jgi:cullin 1